MPHENVVTMVYASDICGKDDSSSSFMVLVDKHVVSQQPKKEQQNVIDQRNAYRSNASRARRTVHFCESKNVVYSNNTGSSKEELSKLCWYKKHDYLRFEEATIHKAHNIRYLKNDSRDSLSWSQSMMRIYLAIQSAKTPNDIMHVIEDESNNNKNGNFCFDAQVTGLVSRIIPAIEQDRRQRRHCLLRDVMYLQHPRRQSSLFLGQHDREQALRLASLRYSRGACIYARFVAHAAVGLA